MPENIDFQALREALARRSNQPGMGQAPATSALSQIGQPTGTTPTGGSPVPATPPQPQLNPPTAQPRFSSPFAGPKPAPGAGLDEETKKLAKGLVSKLLQVL